ncbi:Y-family DNA polymerase [Spiroplasma endosymbiont of Megaselia nigra]|uniref:Y-family DNA polymerase n=1 Tax=Spiroplasma endosymbiont of Megaselia nigra TaxID=2478537 RepID=UPI001F4E2668|nr:hypothetical protein [Spiroplasma endosymbiont of Megaselia nigra]
MIWIFFFASCHQVANQHFQGKPLVVANSSRRAVVTTANYEARQLGINSPMPLYKAKEICQDLEIVKQDFGLYVDFAQKLFDFINMGWLFLFRCV